MTATIGTPPPAQEIKDASILATATDAEVLDVVAGDLRPGDRITILQADGADQVSLSDVSRDASPLVFLRHDAGSSYVIIGVSQGVLRATGDRYTSVAQGREDLSYSEAQRAIVTRDLGTRVNQVEG